MSSKLKAIDLDLPDSEIIYIPLFLTADEGVAFFDYFMEQCEWTQPDIRLFGKTYSQPRLTAFYAKNTNSYSYSNIKLEPLPFDSKLEELNEKIRKLSGLDFSSCLVNLYRSGADSNGWHADDEKELGRNPAIASISLGQDRYFHLRHKTNRELKRKLLLEHGSLLLMKGKTQHFWQHQIPKSKTMNGPRINLTFRIIK